MNVGQIKQLVKRQFGDEAGVQITDTDIVSWINYAQRKIVEQNETLLEISATANSVNATQQYTFPSNLLIFHGLKYKGTGDTAYRDLIGLPYAQFNQFIDGWDSSDSSAQGIPVYYTVRSNAFLVYPVPNQSITNAFKIYYCREPVDVVNDVDTPDLPKLYHDIVVNYCLKQAHELDEDWDAASIKMQEADRDVAYLRGREDWKQEEKYPMITIMPEDW